MSPQNFYSGGMVSKIVELLISKEILEEEQKETIIEYAHNNSAPVVDALVKMGLIEEQKLIKTISEHYNLSLIHI